MADFGFDWDAQGDVGETNNNESQTEGANNERQLPPGVVVNRVAASDRQANPHGTTESELLEPMMEDKAKQLEVKTLENEEENLSALEIFCQRSLSVFIFQRVWAAKEVGRLLQSESEDVGLGILVPIAMQLVEDHELFVRETMAQELQAVLHYYFENKRHADAISARAAAAAKAEASIAAEDAGSSTSSSATESDEEGDDDDTADKPLPALPKRKVVPEIRVPGDEEVGGWLHRVLLTPHPSVSLPAQRAAVGLGRQLSFDAFHTEIVHGVILGLVKNPVHDQIMRQRQRSKEMMVKSRGSGSPTRAVSKEEEGSRRSSGSSSRGSSSSMFGSGLASLFGRRSWQSETSDSSAEAADELDVDTIVEGNSPRQSGFFVSPADEQARLELTRRKLLMLHMIHLVAFEYGVDIRPAVFVPVVERSTKDRTFEVRRDAAAVLGSLAKAVSTDLALDVLFQCFLQLVQDPIWQVRQSAARHALPGLALVLATRSSRPPSTSLQMADSERKFSLQHFAQPDVDSTASHPHALEHLKQQLIAEAAGSGDPLSAFTYRNQPSRSVSDRQWLQLVDRLASTREPSHHVRAAVFESIGKLTLALVDCPRARDALILYVVNDVQRAHSDQGGGGFGLFGSNTSLQSLEEDDYDEEPDEETAAAEEEAAVMMRALNEVHGTPLQSAGAKRGAKDGLPAVAQRMPAKPRGPHRAVGRDILYHSAFNFPALLAALGPQGWDRLRDVYMQLSKTEHYEARQTLACSLHEVARILAANTAFSLAASARLASNRISANGAQSSNPMSSHSADLESVLCLFLIDGVEIKMGALGHLGDTLTWLTPASRVRCLPMIMQVFRHDGKQWRTRELMALQLVKLCHLFPASIVVNSLLPQAVQWAHDPVAGVRAAVAPAFPIMFELTKLDPSTQVMFFETVISFSHAASFRGRLFFVEICAALLAHDHDPDADPVDFDQFFLPSLAALANDRVANVRIALARLVRRMLENRMRRQSISATLADIWAPPPPNITTTATLENGREEDWVDESLNTGRRKSSTPQRISTSRRSSSVNRRKPRRSIASTTSGRLRSNTHGSISSATDAGDSGSAVGSRPRHYAHRSLGSVARRPRRKTTPMRAHLLATMVQQLAKDTDRDVLDLVRDLPGLPITVYDTPIAPLPTDTADAPEPELVENIVQVSDVDDLADGVENMLKQFPRPPLSPHIHPESSDQPDIDDSSALDDLLSNYEREDNNMGKESQLIPPSAISQPLPHNSQMP
ncbi:hypothetical protein H4R24_004387 [Coemansia sp. RSA 988]|nr:hypothetical protein H4R24_004387 [Coemansia sp. RSA 988]